MILPEPHTLRTTIGGKPDDSLVLRLDGNENVPDWPDHGPQLTDADDARRCELIDKSFLGGLTHDESLELCLLQYKADFSPDHVDFFRSIFARFGMTLPRYVTPPPGPPAQRSTEAQITETETLLNYSHAALREMPNEPALVEGREALEARLRELRERAIAEAYRGDEA